MPKLNQIVALEKGLKERTQAAVTEIHRLLQKPPLFAGLSRTYQPKDDDGEKLPPESTLVQRTVKSELEAASKHLTHLFDVVATKEWGNMGAVADVKIGDYTMVSSAPVPYLLFLEKQLVDWRTLVTKIPLLDPADTWAYDEGNDQWRTAPTETSRSKKMMRALVLAPATDKHPAQVQTYNEDVPVGIWSLTKFSGAVPMVVRDELVDRANEMIEAVRVAREEANGTEVIQRKVAKDIFDHLLPQ